MPPTAWPRPPAGIPSATGVSGVSAFRVISLLPAVIAVEHRQTLACNGQRATGGYRFPPAFRRGHFTPGRGRARSNASYSDATISRISAAVSLGVFPTRTPAASRASFLAWAVPAEPDTIAPAWPMVLPSGAVNPAT